MPAVQPGESQSHYLGRCVPMVIEEPGTKSSEHAVAKCAGMYRSKYGMRKKKINRRRKKSRVGKKVYNGATVNTFCPTGEGGGIDPSCKGKGGGEDKYPVNSQSDKVLIGKYLPILSKFLDDYKISPESSDVLTKCDVSKGRCDTVAGELASYLQNQGVKARVVGATGLNPNLPGDAHPEWKSFVKGDKINQKFLWHAVVQTDDAIIDLTGSQYGAKFAGIRVMTPSSFKKEWTSFKTHPLSREGSYADIKPVKSLTATWNKLCNVNVGLIDWDSIPRQIILITNVRKPRPNPLKIDPSRTKFQRDRFIREINRRFNDLKSQITYLIVTRDVFGMKKQQQGGILTAHTFCPTGPGGGIDPTCKGSGVKVKDNAPSLYGTTFEVDGKEFFFEGQKDDEGWHIGFGLSSLRGGNTAALTGDKSTSPVKVLRGVQHSIGMLIAEKKPDKILFTAAKWEGSRVTFYDRIASEIGKAYGYTVESHDYPAIKEYVLTASPTGNILMTANTVWQFLTRDEQLREFLNWLRASIAGTVLEQALRDQMLADDNWLRKYVEDTYRKAMGNAYDYIQRSDPWKPLEGEFYQGAKQEFLRSSFTRPVSIERVKLLASRAFNELQGVTDDMATRIQRTLADGFIKGDSPWTIARDLNNDVDELGKVRSARIARTEVLRAHNEGQLDAMENLGVEEVGVAVEWSTSGLGITGRGYPSPCELCAPLEGAVFSLKEAHGMLPRHPNCMCAWMPANVGESTEGQQRTRQRIIRAIDRSISAERPRSKKRSLAQQRKKTKWTGASKKLSRSRPKSIL
jgi:hypothetical protein